MTRNLKWFTLSAGIWAALYFAALFAILQQTPAPSATLLSNCVVFTAVLSSLEGHFRRRDDPRLVRYDLTLSYSVVAAAASAIVTAGWVLAWRRDPLLVLALGLASVLVILAVAYVRTRGRIKGYSKDELFR
jgi:uncharacterized membrane protein YfcA